MPRIPSIPATLFVSAFIGLASIAQTTAVSPASVVPEARPPAPKLTSAEIAAERDKLAKEVFASIKDRANEPAEKVFKNIKSFTGVPAGRMIAIMKIGYAQSLGVSCTHCHTVGEWEKEDKPQKQIAREMSRLSKAINKELLPKIANLDSKQPAVNCTTCHRGEIKPALDLP
jgi:hypothetical protein